MSRSKRFRVFHVTSNENREFARRGVSARSRGPAPKKHVPGTKHKLKVTVIPEKTSAVCLECSFKIDPSRKFQFVIFDAESHGQIAELDCAKQDERLLLSLIKDIRSGLVDRDTI